MTRMPPLTHTFDDPVTNAFTPEDNDALSDEITRLAGHINAAEYRFLKLLAALVERGAWGGYNGIKSPAHWLNYYCGISLGPAREKVRVAQCLEDLPEIDAAFRSGAISYSKVRAMTRAATPENERLLLQVARYGTAQHVEKLVRKFERTKCRSNPEQDQYRYNSREFHCHYDDDGMLVFEGRLPPEEGAALLEAVDAVLQATDRRSQPAKSEEEGEYGETEAANEEAGNKKTFLQKRHADEATAQGSEAEIHPDSGENVSAETSLSETPEITYAQKRADALVAMAEQALNSLDEGLKPLSTADKYQVMIHIEPDRANRASHHQCSMESNGAHFPLSPEVTRRLACDTSFIPALEDGHGNVLNIGRKTRAVPPAIRRALHMRDQTCRFPGCCESRFVDAHHIQHWCDGGETRLDNLILLCRYHHRLVHEQGFEIVTGEDGQFDFIRSGGAKMDNALYPQFGNAEDATSETLALEADNEEQGLEIDARTAVTGWQGERMDYGFAVGVLMDIHCSGSVSMSNDSNSRIVIRHQ